MASPRLHGAGAHSHALQCRLTGWLLVRTPVHRYMYLLEDATGSRAAAAKIVASVVRTTYDFEHEAEPMLAARAKLAAAIEAAMA